MDDNKGRDLTGHEWALLTVGCSIVFCATCFFLLLIGAIQ